MKEIVGTVVRVNGPIVEAVGMKEARMLEVVGVGEERLIGEVIRIRGDLATVQVYEDTGGLKPGVKLYCTGAPLSVRLGPGLMGTIFDGIQRPLAVIHEHSGAYIRRGERAEPIDPKKLWPFEPVVKKGDELSAGAIFAYVKETELITHRLIVPPTMKTSGTVETIKEAGQYNIEEIVLTLKDKTGQKHEFKMYHDWPSRKPRPIKERLEPDIPLVTGQRVIDTFFPIAKGGTASIPGGFGTGKTMTQHALAKWADADIIVYIGCGERGNEMTDVLVEFPKLIDPKSGRPLLERTIMIANTSNMPVAAREVSIYTGITLAEYFRDQGYDVAVMADSTSRWAEALRELSGRLEEMPAEEGFPAYMAAKIGEFYERAGRVLTLNDQNASVSVVGAVSPPGGDFTEPVTQHTKRFTRCFWALDRDLANARHYPAISWLDSYSEYIEDVSGWWSKIYPNWSEMRSEALTLLQEEERLQQIVRLVGVDVLPESQKLILFIAHLIKDAFLQQNSFDVNDMYSTPEKQTIMLRLILQAWHHGQNIVKKGHELSTLHNMNTLNEVLRMKNSITNEQIDKLKDLEQRFVEELKTIHAQEPATSVMA